MSEQQRTIDRRTLLKLVGAAGASATVASAGRPPSAASSAAPASNLAQSDIELFQLFVSDDELEDLGRRLASPRWPAAAPGEPWAAGTPRRVQRDPLTDEEREYVSSVNRWSVEETGYQRIQETKPQTLAFGLTDSPVGLAAWLTEKLRSWSDCGGDVESRFSKDQILTLVSIYWHTRTIGTSARYYYANGLVGSSGARRARPEVAAALMGTAPIRVPQGWAEFLGIPGRTRPPRSFVDELPANVTHWQVYDSGGHFPAFEEPELLVQDLRTFFRPLRSA